MHIDYLQADAGRRLAYNRVAPAPGNTAPGVVFLCGFRSDMTGTKAEYLADWARRSGRGFLRFDYTGHGQSSGEFTAGCIGDWARDARDVISACTQGPQILVGSSMGGWLALLTARALPGRVAGLVGVAAAPDFTEDGIPHRLSPAQRAELEETGRVALPSAYDDIPTVITRRLLEEGRDNLVLRAPLPLPFPVRLLAHADCPDLRLILFKDADHRLSTPACLAAIVSAIEEVTAVAG